MRFPDVEVWRFVAPAVRRPAEFPDELPFLPLLPGWWGRTRRAARCSWSIAFDPDLDRDLPSRPEEAQGRFAELRRGAQSVTCESGPAAATWSDQGARKQVLEAVSLVADEFVTLAEAAGWRTQWEDPEPYDIPVLRRQEYFVREEWALQMIALSGAYWGGLEVSVSLRNGG